jgi:hypothetical protein
MSMTDREMLELAAKAAGYNFITLSDTGNGDEQAIFAWAGRDPIQWNPLLDSGQALELAIYLKLNIIQQPRMRISTVDTFIFQEEIDEPYGDDPYAATRRAITRAAAEIGKAMGMGE